MHSVAEKVTQNVVKRSKDSRQAYLDLMGQVGGGRPDRSRLSCGNLAHGYAACEADDKSTIKLMDAVNIGIVTAYNDMLSAHQPYQDYPDKIKQYAREIGATAQVAGGVPAMCDGVTQGQTGMELSLFSRDNIAQATAVALSHQMFDSVICLGICDKIVPGMIIGSLRFGHVPVVFLPAGPMPSGLPNKEKARVRQLYAEGKVGREELLEAESASYHSAGTCTFYGTANSNQVIMEAMGLQLPGSSFVNPGTELREALTRETVYQSVRIAQKGANFRPMSEVVDERSFINAVVALLASGGSTNHSIHLIAMARAAGIILNWDDFDELSSVVPLLARVYPNGQADINHFQAAGGTGYIFKELLSAGFMHADALTVWGASMSDYVKEPKLKGEGESGLDWRTGTEKSLDPEVLATVAEPFDKEGGLRVLKGNLGRSVIKISAVAPEHRKVSAPAVVLSSQHELQEKFESGELNKDCVVVVRYQGPSANGMPELHKLTPPLGVLQDRGYKVALVTDGRMSGASGKVPAAIHLSPEAIHGGAIAKVREGDLITLDAENGTLHCEVDDAEFQARDSAEGAEQTEFGVGRELFSGFRRCVTSAEQGATALFPPLDQSSE